MQDFDLRKYMSNNKLHQSDIGGFSITELQQTSKSDFEIGLAILNEIGYDFSEELLTEIKIKDLLSKAGSAIKGSLESLAFNKSSSKDSKKDFTKKLALLKKLSPSEEVYNKFIKLLKSGKKTTVSDLTKLASSSSKKQIDEKWLTNMPGGVRKTMEWLALGIYLLGFAQNLNYTPKEIDLSNQTATTINVGDDYQPILGDVGDVVDDNAKEDIKDIADEDVDDEVVNSFDTESNYLMSSVDDDGFEFWMGNGIGDIDGADIDKAIDKAIKDLKSKFPNLKKITLTDNATWTDTQGDDASDDKAKDGGSVSKDRQDTSNKINKLLKKAIEDNFEDAEVTHVEKDAVKDSSKEFEAGSLEAKQAQKVGSTWSDIQDGEADTDDVSPDDTGDTDIKQANTIPPQDIIGFYSQKPDFDSNKYMVIAFQFLPRIIGNGKIVNNPAFERFAKHLTIAKSGETFNDAFIKRRIGGRADKTGGSLVKKAAKAKGKEKKEILDTIDTLRWIRNTKKSPSSLSKGIKALDPNIKLGERGVIKSTIGKKGQKIPATAFKKGEQKPKAGQATRQKGSDNKGKSGLMERLEKLIPTTLQLTEITKAPGFNQDSAKENLGLLTHLFSGIWSGKDDSFIEFDNAYLEDKYKSSVDDFYTKFPSIGEKIKLKVKEKEKVSTSTTAPTSTTKSTSSSIKVGDTVELDPKVKKTKKTKGIPTDPELAKDFDLKDTPTEKDVSLSGDKMDIKTGLDRSYKFIDTKEELQKLLVALLTVNINDTLRKNPAKLRTILFQVRNRFNPKGQPELKENLDFIIEAVEGMPKDTAKAIKFLNQYSDVQTLLKKINQPEELIQFILRELLPELKPAFLKKSADIKGAIVGASNVIGKLQPKDLESSKTVSKSQAKDIAKQLTAEQIKSLIKNILTEGLTPGQASKVKDKYNQIYSGMLKGDKKKLLKYIDPKFNRPNPDAMATGRAINLVKKEEDENIEEVYSKEQRKWACAQDDPKFDEMCKDTAISKKKKMKEEVTDKEENKLKKIEKELNKASKMHKSQADRIGKIVDENKNRLTELIKTALKGPVEEESFPDLTGDGKVTKADILKGRGVKLEEGTELVDKHGYEFKRFSMGKEGPGLQITDKTSSNPAGTFIHIPGSKLGFFASALTDAIRVFDDMSRQLPVDESLTERILKELRGNVNEQDYKFQDAKDLTVKPLRPLLKSVAKKVADEIEKMAKSGKFQKIQDNEGAVGNADLSLALGVEVLAALQDKI